MFRSSLFYLATNVKNVRKDDANAARSWLPEVSVGLDDMWKEQERVTAFCSTTERSVGDARVRRGLILKLVRAAHEMAASLDPDICM